MQLHTVTHIDALAVCNDGSPGAYYHRPGTAGNSTRLAVARIWVSSIVGCHPIGPLAPRSWVIRFLGGAWCWDGPSCAARNATTPFLMSTSLLPPATSADAHSPGREARMRTPLFCQMFTSKLR